MKTRLLPARRRERVGLALRRVDQWLVPVRVVSGLAKIPWFLGVAAMAAGGVVWAVSSVWPSLPLVAQIGFAVGGGSVIAKGFGELARFINLKLAERIELPASVSVRAFVRSRSRLFHGEKEDGWSYTVHHLRITNLSKGSRLSLSAQLLVPVAHSRNGWPKFVVENYRLLRPDAEQASFADWNPPLEVAPESTWSGGIEFLITDSQVSEVIGRIDDLTSSNATLELNDLISGAAVRVDLTELGTVAGN